MSTVAWPSWPSSSTGPSRSGCRCSHASSPTSSCARRRSTGRYTIQSEVRPEGVTGEDMSNHDVENVIIIGSGPAGYTAALYTARANLNPLVIEGWMWGGLLQQTTDVENFPGYPQGVMGPQMMQELRDQSERFGARFVTENVTRVEPATAEGEPHTVWVDEDEYKAESVILAMGAEHKKLGVAGEEELGGRGARYCAAGDSAMEEAICLAKFSCKVTIVNRRDEFRASKIMLERARSMDNIEFLTPYVVDAFLAGENGLLDRSPVRNVEN